MKKYLIILLSFVIVYSCKISYQFNGASIDYNVIRTIRIVDFQNQATNIYPPLAQYFNGHLKDIFTRNTKLVFTNVDPDLELEGEIIRYEFTPIGVTENITSERIRLTMDVRIRFRNNKNPDEDKEQTFSANRDYSSSMMLNDVQDQLMQELTEDLVDQIFNATMANW